MTYAPIRAARYKATMEHGSVASPNAPSKGLAAHIPARDTFSAQTPLVVIGLAAISMIFLIHSHAPSTAVRGKPVVAYSCSDCGTVVAVRRGTDAPSSYLVQIQMLDGSLRTIPQAAPSFSIGDVVRLHGDVLTLRPSPS